MDQLTSFYLRRDGIIGGTGGTAPIAEIIAKAVATAIAALPAASVMHPPTFNDDIQVKYACVCSL